MRSYWIVLALGACSEPAIDMSLRMPPSVPADFALDCLGGFEVIALGEDQGAIDRPPDNDGDCVPLSGITSWRDLQRAVKGQVEIDLPDSGLLGIAVRAFAGSCEDAVPFHEGVIYGSARGTGGDLTIPLNANLSCTARGKVVNIHPVDMLALAQSKACSPIVDGRAFSGDFRPMLLGDAWSQMTFESGASASSRWTNGSTSIEVYSAPAYATTCIAAAFNSPTDQGGANCIEDNKPTLCAATGEVELGVVAYDYMNQSRDVELIAQYGQPVLGAVWEISANAMKTPIANATVTLDDPSQGTVVYYDRGPSRFTKAASNATTADGFFMVYLKGGPTTITVSSPIHASQKYKIATAEDYSTLVAALTRR